MGNSEIVGYWNNNGTTPVVKIDGELYALHGYNGEKYLHCWKCLDCLTEAEDNIEYEIIPIWEYNSEFDLYEITDYVLN